MATVYRGFDVTLGREVAIKVLDAQLARDHVFRTRFRMEAQAASRMSNAAIVRVFDAGEHDDDGTAVPYIVMELVSGRTLKEVIAAGPVPQADALRYVDGILEALEYSHRAGVIHRDIKPGNVMVTPEGKVKVMDFGIARAVSDSSSTVAETTSIIGTAAYFSPEQAKGEPVDARTDLYSTGIVLYELLAGRQPFRGDSPVAVAYQHVSETPQPPSEVVETVPRALDAVVLRALAKDPFGRFPDAATFRAAVAGAQEGREPTKRQLDNLTNELYGANPRVAAETARALRQLSTDTTMTRTQQGPPVAWIWSGVALIAIVLISVVVWVVGASQPTDEATPAILTVPDVSDMTYAKAEETLTGIGLEVKEKDEPSSEVSEGRVIGTSPEAGTAFETGDDILVTVSTGVEKTAVPKLTGLSEDQAKAAITAAKLSLGSVTRTNVPSVAGGTVLDAADTLRTPLVEGREIAVGTKVNLTIATGRVTLNNYQGNSIDGARQEITDPEGLNLKIAETPIGTCDGSVAPLNAGQKTIIVSQSPVPGDVDITATVTVTYCDVH